MRTRSDAGKMVAAYNMSKDRMCACELHIAKILLQRCCCVVLFCTRSITSKPAERGIPFWNTLMFFTSSLST